MMGFPCCGGWRRPFLVFASWFLGYKSKLFKDHLSVSLLQDKRFSATLNLQTMGVGHLTERFLARYVAGWAVSTYAGPSACVSLLRVPHCSCRGLRTVFLQALHWRPATSPAAIISPALSSGAVPRRGPRSWRPVTVVEVALVNLPSANSSTRV